MYKVFNDKTTTDKIQMSGRKTYSSGMLCGYVSPQKLKEFRLKLEVKSFSKRSNEVIIILVLKIKGNIISVIIKIFTLFVSKCFWKYCSQKSAT